ncbi:MAG: hypothetical protein KDC07_06015, partial [Chitinophagaceae bacterium]|nr:hypothetical protein [Chitinophagaceae bacterium]
MKKIIALAGIILLSTSFGTYAQKSSSAIGLRATPDGGGVTFKTFFSPHLSFEAQANVGGVYGGNSFTGVALLEGNIIMPDPSWRIIMGGGVHAGVWDNGAWYRQNEAVWVYDRPEPIVGIDAIGGVEYIFKKIPLSLSAAIKPAVNFTSRGPEFFSHNMFGASAR